ncbi:Auxin-responsive protein [Thalictrum thalictroides]|uniref:Auxin-responsive protein n=1 Tax=Thalictrum thalictroides TaxID=46969 RepID=A0A7J6VU85_THATH|nr:Auxin-responsive protein [Thalictrum thalictroides]
MGLTASKFSKIIKSGNGFKRLKGPPMAPRGYVPVCVGVENETKRFMVHRNSLHDIEFVELLYKSAEEYGFCNQGILRIPYDAKEFEDWVIRGARTLKVRPA